MMIILGLVDEWLCHGGGGFLLISNSNPVNKKPIATAGGYVFYNVEFLFVMN